MNQLKLRQQLQAFLLEDIGEKDMTSQTIFSPNHQGEGLFIAKESGVIAGLTIIEETYRLLDSKVKIQDQVRDGDLVEKGDVLAKVSGPVTSILTGERVILNLLQRMSGIATLTKKSITALNDSSIDICDTRKTTPGLRMFEKYAVTVGGGKNHRFGLYDAVMIKDNHIAFCGSITDAVKRVKEQLGHMVKVEVETETKEDVLEAVKAGVDVIMFDNCTPQQVKEFAPYVPEHIVTEASGGITLESLPTYAHTGVDVISLGYLTHSVSALDISLVVNL
ncbi:nicotinate-nucleotide pyrophosphorylase (carboxylating) [Cerasibacillus quisquiliarum]|uniref:Probable nicotinate-nucleotide pyrophosphorylase [carboxylating] n=1 Tax=Cerasibacillus quisquiliarum TaxID=227865 RepID=A0A511UY89_9BACI|nr:carboxylating nicotinate-nucleotide diphosphorylase [Cerasibacillus quisquiliarum]MBB5146798.1 nicotinate-nucleotide pyrophosphorylase (carboxylating) [Cerasibacillus quisquiliarum]GEN31597.1 nicotinate-nucleotide diphosphorylase (carboxylating) [Cerasibacillus quisquiliarum]